MNNFNKIFLKGLVTALPILLTIYLLFWVIIGVDNILGIYIRQILPEGFYIPGFGIIVSILLIFLFGLLLNNFFSARFVIWLEKTLNKVPFIKAIYSPLKDLMNLFSKDGNKQMKSVVLVRFGDEFNALGIVTRDNFKDLPPQIAEGDRVAVYMPLSYGLGGFTILVEKSRIQEIDLPVERAMSLAITGWVKSEKKKELS